MTEINEKDEDLLKKKRNTGKGRGSWIIGLVLIVVAVAVYGYRNGFFKSAFNNKKDSSVYLTEALVEKMEKADRFVLSEIELLPEGRGTAVGKVQVRKDGVNSLADLLLGNVTLDFHYTENGYAITESNWNILLTSFDFGDIDVKKIASSGVLKNSRVKKLIREYRLIYFNELFKNAVISRDDNFINNLGGVLLVETEMKFELLPDDFDRAIQACFDTAKKDKALKKVYRSFAQDDVTYEEFLDNERQKADSRMKGDTGIKRLSGAFYINVSEGLTMADLLIEPLDDADGRAAHHLKAGYTCLNNKIGFVLNSDDGTNVVNLLGSGNYSSGKTTFNTTGNILVKGPKAKDPAGDEIKFTTNDLKLFRSGEVYASGTVILDYVNDPAIDKKNVFFESENGIQRAEIIMVKNDGSTEKTDISITR